MYWPPRVILGGTACGPVITVILVEEGDPSVTIYFKDGTTLVITGLTEAQRAVLDEAKLPVHDDIRDSAWKSEVDFGRPHFYLGGELHSDRRIQRNQWTESVERVEFTRAAGTQGLYLALVAAGWATAVSRRIDIHYSLRAPLVAARNSVGLAHAIRTVFRTEGRDYVAAAA